MVASWSDQQYGGNDLERLPGFANNTLQPQRCKWHSKAHIEAWYMSSALASGGVSKAGFSNSRSKKQRNLEIPEAVNCQELW